WRRRWGPRWEPAAVTRTALTGAPPRGSNRCRSAAADRPAMRTQAKPESRKPQALLRRRHRGGATPLGSEAATGQAETRRASGRLVFPRVPRERRRASDYLLKLGAER